MWQDGEQLVKDSAGQLSPTMSGSVPGNNWYSIYDDEKGAQLIAKASTVTTLLTVCCASSPPALLRVAAQCHRMREYVAEGLMDG